MTEKKIGKITSVRFGFVGYQDAQFGLHLDLGSDKDGWGVVTTVNGGWSTDPYTDCNWTIEDQSRDFAAMCRGVVSLLTQAKVNDVTRLAGIPIEATFDGNILKDWRILTEAI